MLIPRQTNSGSITECLRNWLSTCGCCGAASHHADIRDEKVPLVRTAHRLGEKCQSHAKRWYVENDSYCRRQVGRQPWSEMGGDLVYAWLFWVLGDAKVRFSQGTLADGIESGSGIQALVIFNPQIEPGFAILWTHKAADPVPCDDFQIVNDP